MGRYTFRWPHPADEVYVTGTFDNWQKTVKMDTTTDGFAKDVDLPDRQKINYKFVVDGNWTTDGTSPREDDGHNNINNFLLPHQIHPPAATETAAPSAATLSASTMSGVTPDSTTAQMAGNVPKETGGSTVNGPGAATISSAAPDSTTAHLAKDVPREGKTQDGGPSTSSGTCSEAPAKQESEQQFAVNPIPASAGAGNPVHLQPGEKVPDPATINGSNTIESTVRTDKAGYEADASAAGMTSAPATGNSNNLNSSNNNTDGPTIQSAAPDSSTANMAQNAPLESTQSKSSTAEDVPNVVRESIERSHSEPEAAASSEAVEEKKEVERELLKEVPPEQSAGTPPPVESAEKSTSAPGATGGAAAPPAPRSGDISPKTKEPGEPKPADEPAVTTGPETTTAPEKSGPSKQQPSQEEEQKKKQETPEQQQQQPGEGEGGKGKKKHRMSGMFSKLKEKLK